MENTITRLFRTLPVAAVILLPPLLLGWALVQAASYLN